MKENSCNIFSVVFLSFSNKPRKYLQELPHEFIEVYGLLLRRKVTLFMGDGNKFRGRFCVMTNLLYELEELFACYSLQTGFFLFFDYVAPSVILLTVYSDLCVDILNGNPNNLSYKDICKKFEVNAITLMSDSSEDSSGT